MLNYVKRIVNYLFTKGEEMQTQDYIISKLIPQTHLPYPYDKYACNYRVLQSIGEIVSSINLTKEQIMFLAEHHKDQKYIDNSPNSNIFDVYVYKPEDVINSTLSFLGDGRKAWNCGYVKDGISLNWQNKPISEFDFSIIKLYQQNKALRHFVLGDRYYNLLFDPTPNSISAQLWNIKDIYLYKIV